MHQIHTVLEAGTKVMSSALQTCGLSAVIFAIMPTMKDINISALELKIPISI